MKPTSAAEPHHHSRNSARRRMDWARTVYAVLCQADALTCALCGEPITKRHEISVDHIVPKSKGGATDYHNFQPAHARCNNKKGCND